MANDAATQAGLDKILQTPVEQITKDFIESLFANYHDRDANEFKQAPFKPTISISTRMARGPLRLAW